MRSTLETSFRDKSRSETWDSAEAAKPHQIEVSVVIPCLNEARSIGFCVDKAIAAFRDTGIAGEVVVADNGSSDGSMAIAFPPSRAQAKLKMPKLAPTSKRNIPG